MSAMQSSGQSPFKTLLPIFFLGVLMSSGSYEMSEHWLPDANHKRFEIMETNAQKRKNPRIKEKQDFTFIDSEKNSWFFTIPATQKKALMKTLCDSSCQMSLLPTWYRPYTCAWKACP